ncbi:MAG: alpha/beta fold hydrolase [Chloroflexi bacterium]|nr:alpha/beta fold hydrolase [Chloroflexota bacterium]
MAEHRFVDVGGIRTHYVVAGEGPPLLLLHGLGATLIAWAANIAPLAQKFTVYAPDIPGHGESDKPDLDYRVPTGAKFIRDFMHTLGIPRAYIIGNSMGGILALRAALDYPSLVEKLVLVDAAGLGRRLSWYLRIISLPLIGDVLEPTSLRGARALLRNIFYDRSLVQDGLVQELYHARSMPGAKRAVLKTIRGAVNMGGLKQEWVMAKQLNELQAPTLIVWGSQDRLVPVEDARAAVQQAPGVRLHIFDQCGHWPQLEKAGEFNQMVLDFLGGP